ncbi:MAG: hypothetical protein LBT11_00210 [Treponema sp.]|nr:hypothetical protein [Treponema sp.]
MLANAGTRIEDGPPAPPPLSQAAAFGAPSGLGLSIVKTALDRLGISFALENTPEGVCFWMDLEELPQ